LKTEYVGGVSAENKLAVKDASVKIRLELFAAVHKARAGRPNRGPFLELCETCESLNQSEVVGIFRHCLTSVNPSAGADMLDTGKVVTKMVWRLSLAKDFLDEVKVLKPWLHLVVCAATEHEMNLKDVYYH
jgi:hypothetical protein